MDAIDWNSCPKVGQDFMDKDHHDTVIAINALWQAATEAKSGDAQKLNHLIDLFSLFEKHLAEHFAREEAAMKTSGFFAFDCHQGEHARVLGLVATQRVLLENGDIDAVADFIESTLPDWFFGHLATMDSVTAQFLSQSGYVAA